MGEVLRYYILIAIIIYVIGMEIYKNVRSRTIDYLLWAIVGLFGIAIWLSSGFYFGVPGSIAHIRYRYKDGSLRSKGWVTYCENPEDDFSNEFGEWK